MKVKTSELVGPPLDWAVAESRGDGRGDEYLKFWRMGGDKKWTYCEIMNSPSVRWSEGGPIIDENDITTFRLDDVSIPNAKGFWQNKYRRSWGASLAGSLSPGDTYGPQGDHWGRAYSIDEDGVMEGPTPLIAAMRCFVASNLGDEVEIPEELLK